MSGDDARGRILEAAMACVAKYGVDKTGMEDVARAAEITRPTIYKYFPSRSELIMAVFLRTLDDRLERGLADFFVGLETAADFRGAVADAAVYVLEVLRSDDTLQSILSGERSPTAEVLAECATIINASLQNAIEALTATVTGTGILGVVRPIDTERAAAWSIRTLYSFLVWPGESREDERRYFLDGLAPLFVLDD